MIRKSQIASFYDGELDYWPQAYLPLEAESLFLRLKQELAWREDKIKLFGKVHKVPRLQAWYGDKGCDYQYSGLTLPALTWTQTLAEIKSHCESLCYQIGILAPDEYFNGVLANLYRDGNDTVGWHADNERVLGEHPVIASVTFGSPRDFAMRHNKTKDKQRIRLDSGSVLVMSGATQHNWQHSLPRTKKTLGERINLSFRILKK